MLRKHVISLDKRSQKNVPFTSWNCITLYLKNRELDLVIKSEKEMEMFLKLLIMNLNTVDGKRDSGVAIT